MVSLTEQEEDIVLRAVIDHEDELRALLGKHPSPLEKIQTLCAWAQETFPEVSAMPRHGEGAFSLGIHADLAIAIAIKRILQ